MGLPVWNTGECPWCNAVAPLDRRFGTVLCSGCRRDVLEILAGEDLLEDTQALQIVRERRRGRWVIVC